MVHKEASCLEALRRTDLKRWQDALQKLEDERAADVWRLVVAQDMALATAKDQVLKVLTCARIAARKAIGQDVAEDQEVELRQDRKVTMARDQVKVEVLAPQGKQVNCS